MTARTAPISSPDTGRSFPSTSSSTSVDDLKRSGIWTDVRIDPDGFDSWMSILAGEWLIDQPLSYRDIVDPGPAEAAVQAVGSTVVS